VGGRSILRGGIDSLRAGHLTGLHALGADVHALDVTVQDGGDLLDVRTEHTVRHAVRVAHVATRGRALAAYSTYLGHDVLLVTRAATPADGCLHKARGIVTRLGFDEQGRMGRSTLISSAILHDVI